jgi:uncharacterized protein
MSRREETRALVALWSAGAASLVRRGIEDFLAKTEADEWFEKGMALWKRESHSEAVRSFARCLQLQPDHDAAQFYVGLALYRGLGVAGKDLEQAVVCWRKAAEQGHAQAQNNLAVAYWGGEGVARNYNLAVSWFRRAADQDDANAQYNLAVMYESGVGVPQDFEQAVTWYARAAEQGSAAAQYNLGGMFRLGRGVDEDSARAAFWYREAARQGHSTAQFNLGAMHESGQGVEENLEHAAHWYYQAAENGEEGARQALVDTLKKLERRERDGSPARRPSSRAET